ncbi:uncharacterized protein LOC125169872 isoform X2 [Prionailurus viverrinus]|uniref:uncharacterized protein LOC125169872 isoform X2 n=1 Tax=Prionailurus viverrinus TaxID=61388 RepID=UPI001FF5E7AE|nr:uncharacterized protein LOC125169872 isoform X2 [Prionailurus viverrinus]
MSKAAVSADLVLTTGASRIKSECGLAAVAERAALPPCRALSHASFWRFRTPAGGRIGFVTGARQPRASIKFFDNMREHLSDHSNRETSTWFWNDSWEPVLVYALHGCSFRSIGQITCKRAFEVETTAPREETAHSPVLVHTDQQARAQVCTSDRRFRPAHYELSNLYTQHAA